MAKKRAKPKKKSLFNVNEMVMGFVKSFLLGTFKDQVKQMVDDALDAAHTAVINTVKTIGKLFFSGIAILFGFVFLIFSLVFLTKDYLDISMGWALFIWAFILMLFGLIYGVTVIKKSERD